MSGNRTSTNKELFKVNQDEFDLTIGRLDRTLSKLVIWGKAVRQYGKTGPWPQVDEANAQTLKHHAEDMVAAGQKILKDLGENIEGTPQPTL